MNQRLFFLFPDREHALNGVNELMNNGIDSSRMHALGSRRTSLTGLPESSTHQRRDLSGRIEFWGWRINLALFFVAAACMAALILLQAGLWWLLPLAVMAGTFLLGERFSHWPNTHLGEFREALEHGEILLMVDVSPDRINEVEYRMLRHHPEAVAGGSCWNMPALGT